MNNKELFEIKKKQVEDYRASGLTAKEWCKQNSVTRSNLRYWVTKLNRMKPTGKKADGAENDFIIFMPPPKGIKPIIVKCGEFTIEVAPGSDKETLRMVTYALRGL
jgi:phenolic acid decarboxylase